MKYLLLATILIVAGLLYFKAPASKNQHICKLNNDNIITIGDSLANGFGVNPENSFAVKTAVLLGKNPIKKGVDGETTSELLNRIDDELKATPSIAAVIISIGGNDFLKNRDEETVKSNLNTIVQRAKKYTDCIVLLGVPSGVFGSVIGGISSIYKDVSDKFNIIVEDKAMQMILKDINLKVDYIHPNTEGHEIIANNIANLIKNNQ